MGRRQDCRGPFDHMCHYYDRADGRLGWEMCPLLAWWLAPIALAGSLLIVAPLWLLF